MTRTFMLAAAFVAVLSPAAQALVMFSPGTSGPALAPKPPANVGMSVRPSQIQKHLSQPSARPQVVAPRSGNNKVQTGGFSAEYGDQPGPRDRFVPHDGFKPE